MAVAKAYPEPEKGGRGKVGAVKLSNSIRLFSSEYLTKARAVLRVLMTRRDSGEKCR